MIDCARCNELLEGYLELTLSTSNHAAVARHLTACARCEEIVASITSAAELARRATDVKMPRDARERLRSAIAKARRRG